MGTCAGEEYAAFLGMGMITSYLILFISFYLATYKKDPKTTSSRKALRRMSQAPLPHPNMLVGRPNSSGTGAAKAGPTAASTRTRRA